MMGWSIINLANKQAWKIATEQETGRRVPFSPY
jgi:hypothetical protein